MLLRAEGHAQCPAFAPVSHPVFALALHKRQFLSFSFLFFFFISFGPEFGLCMQLFLVPYSFFVHSSRRGVSRCKHFGRSQPVLILTGIFFPKINVLISRVKRMSEELLINLYVIKGFCVFFFLFSHIS